MTLAHLAPETLRVRLTLWYVSALALALVLFALLLYSSLSRTLYRHHDRELELDAERVRATLERSDVDLVALADALNRTPSLPLLLMVRDGRGNLVYRSPVLAVAEPSIGQHEALIHAAAHAPAEPEFFTATLERTGDVRFICTPFGSPTRGYLQIGSPLGDVPTTLNAVAVASAVLVPFVLVLTSLGGWAIAQRALSPIAAVDETLQAIGATDLSRRVQVHPADRELHSLVSTVNGLLARLERAFDDLRNFGADVSHQMKTPLSVMQGTIEAARQSPRVDSAEFLDSLEAEVRALAAVISDLQTLNLVDTAHPTLRTRVDLSAACVEVRDIVAALGEPTDLTIESDIEESLVTVGNAVQIKHLLLNLGDNAVKFTPAGGTIRIEARPKGDMAVVTVSDNGTGLAQADLSRVFERFYTASRQRGAGLGLAIAQRIATVHGGRIYAANRPGGGAVFTVELPLA